MQGPRCLVALRFLTILTLLATCLPSAISAADEWLPIDPADLALKDNPASPGSHAMILYREVEANDQISRDEEYTRIKIFDQQGEEYGNIEIPYITGTSRVDDLRARTIHPDGKIIPFEGKPLDKLIIRAGGIKVLAKTFSLADVQPGSILEYRYEMEVPWSGLRPSAWFVQNDLFTRLEKFTMIPFLNAYFPGTSTRYLWQFHWRAFNLPSDVAPTPVPGGYQLELHDIPGYEGEESSPPEDEMRGRISFFYTFLDPAKGPTTWESLGKAYDEGIEKFLSKHTYLDQVVAQTVTASDSSEAKLQKLYARAQQLRNLSLEAPKSGEEEKRENLKTAKSVDDVMKNGYGNSTEINWVFLAMARSAGIAALPAFVTSREKHIFHPEMLSLGQLDASLVVIPNSSKGRYLDPACRQCAYGMLPWEETAAGGIELAPEGGKVFETPKPQSDANVIRRTATLELSADGSATGKLKVQFTGQFALEMRRDTQESDALGRADYCKKEITDWLPHGSKFELASDAGWEASADSLECSGSFEILHLGVAAGPRLLIPAGILHTQDPHAFQGHGNSRIQPVCFHYPYEETDDVTVKMPAGYSTENLPPPGEWDLEGFRYETNALTEGNQLHLARHFIIPEILVPSTEFVAVQATFAAVRQGDDKQIVLLSPEGDAHGETLHSGGR